MSIEALEQDARRALTFLGEWPANWIPSVEGVDYDVVVIGAGQSGTAVAASLRRAGISKIAVFDASHATSVGMWSSKAYMETLRTPKSNIGPELGIPELTYRAWFEAQHGAEAYKGIDLIDRLSWNAYLGWIRKVLEVNAFFETKVLSVNGAGNRLDLVLDRAGGIVKVRTRKLVLATGVEGTGSPDIPNVVQHGLKPNRYAHTYSRLNPKAVDGVRVAVLGAGSSAFDAAAFALENGAKEVGLFCRQPDLARSTSLRSIAYPGIEHFHLLPDQDKWRVARLIKARGSVPTINSITRVTKYGNFQIHLGTPWTSVSEENGAIRIGTPKGKFTFDYALLGTGFRIDPTLRPELSAFAPQIATWEDYFQPHKEDRDDRLGRYPYLGSGYRLKARVPSSHQFIENIHCFNAAALPSFGRHLGDVASLRPGVVRLVETISADLFHQDRVHHMDRFSAQPPEDLNGDEYRMAIRA